MLYSDLDFERAPWDSVSPECKDLVQSLLQRDPAKRPTAAQALQHRYPCPHPLQYRRYSYYHPLVTQERQLFHSCPFAVQVPQLTLTPVLPPQPHRRYSYSSPLFGPSPAPAKQVLQLFRFSAPAPTPEAVFDADYCNCKGLPGQHGQDHSGAVICGGCVTPMQCQAHMALTC